MSLTCDVLGLVIVACWVLVMFDCILVACYGLFVSWWLWMVNVLSLVVVGIVKWVYLLIVSICLFASVVRFT